MKVPLTWLRELVELDAPLPELRRRLTMAGLEVEDVHQVGSDWQDITIGRIVELERHPRRDTLNVAGVDLGDRTVTVVTGAPNLHVGDVVPHVAPGGRLPLVGVVVSRDFGGITSEGMVCSGDELHISSDKDGIYIFEPDAPVGQRLEDYLDEVIFDIYITANRPDCMSMMGIAREVHALFGAPYTPTMSRLLDPASTRVDGSPGAPAAGELLSVRIEDPVGCPRFTASVVQGVQMGASPEWLRRRLFFAGVRPISNIVDVTNYVMLEVGQPLHAFDRQRLESSTIVVRRARDRERLRTLDGEERQLTASMLVVADERQARSLAGVMGGEESEIAESTREVVLEAASWDRASVRSTSAALTLSTEASRRFGRGVDPDLTALGVARATQLTLELAGGRAAAGTVDEYPGRESPRTIHVRPEQIDALIGLHYVPDQVTGTLDALGFPVEQRGEELMVTVPGWRRFDVEGVADIAEEVGRVVGFDLVPASMPRGALPSPRADGDAGLADEMRARNTLAAVGLQEVITYSLIDPGMAAELSMQPMLDGVAPAAIQIANPQSVEQSVLRPSLLGGMLSAVRSNLRQRDRVLVYELARTWHRPLAPLPQERRHVGMVMVGPRSPSHFTLVDDSTSSGSRSEDTLDYFDLKGVVDVLCGAFRASVTYVPGRHPSLHPGRSAEVHVAGQRVGVLGQLHPVVAERFGLDAPSVLVAELDFESLLAAREPLLTVHTPSRFPPADRDIAIVVDEDTPHAAVEAAIRNAARPLLERVQLFDVYRGRSIPENRKSLAFSLRYRALDRTLEEDEVGAVHARVEETLRSHFQAEVRGR
ncbi:MAG: phenylalanine--tRNA ligase subunit beta [Chloroflexota bacterium]|nr:phenylalanine--tRNA ligase subunit beta [Chloroflexota bacterium]